MREREIRGNNNTRHGEKTETKTREKRNNMNVESAVGENGKTGGGIRVKNGEQNGEKGMRSKR